MDKSKYMATCHSYCSFDKLGICYNNHGIFCKYRIEEEKRYGIIPEWISLEECENDIQDYTALRNLITKQKKHNALGKEKSKQKTSGRGHNGTTANIWKLPKV